MSSRKISLQIWRLQRLSYIQKALRPSDSPLQLATQALRRGSPIQRHYSSNRDRDFTVREFIRKSPDDDDTVEIEPDVENKVEAEVLRSEVEQLRREIQELQEGPFGPNSEFMRSLPPDLREKALKALKERGENRRLDLDLEEDITDEDFDRIVNEEDIPIDDPLQNKKGGKAQVPSISLSLPPKIKAYITQFNQALNQASNDPDKETTQLALWKSYLRCRSHVPGFAEMVTDEVWDVLWFSQSQNPEHYKNLLTLAQDILENDRLLTGAQWLEYLKCMNTAGDSKEALERWEEVRSVVEAEEDTKDDSLDLGIRLYAVNGRAQDALELATRNSGQKLPAERLIPIISAFARQKSEKGAEKAWALYLRMKSTIGPDLTMEQYEQVSTALLTADKPDLALAVFKDMLLHKRSSSNDSLALFKAAHGYLDDIQAKNVTEEDVNRVSLAALTILPRSFQNKYFYASWIKKLIGLGEIDAAATVVELMYARGVKPDAKHLNGIIGGWMRLENDDAGKKAEAMAWSMIEQRFRFVKERGQGVLVPARESFKQVAINRPIPPATVETFSILLQYYLNSGQASKAEHLMSGFQAAEITPDAFVMNQWISAHLRRGNVAMVWKKYDEYRSDGIRPDLETFARLFDCGKIQYDAYKSIDPPNFPRARIIFSELASWLNSLSEHGIREVKDQFTRDLYDQIIRCFSLSHDLRGALCAMHGIRHEIGMLPDANTTRMILLSVSRHLGAADTETTTPESAAPVQGKSRLGRRRRGQNPKTSVSKVTALLNAVADKKTWKVSSQGVDPEAMSEEEKAEIQLQILTEFIVIVLARNVPEGMGSRTLLQERILRVAESMGLKELDVPWDELETEL